MPKRKQQSQLQKDNNNSASGKKRRKSAEPESDAGLLYGLKWKSVGEPLTKNIPPLIVLDSDTVEGRQKERPSDWEWWEQCVPEKLQALDKDGYRIIFVSNQAGVEKGKTTIQQLQKKCTAIVQKLSIPVFIYLSTGESHYRKPGTEMWEYFLKHSNKSVKKTELIVMVGMPASGKSSFVKKYLVPRGYIHINRDTLGTMAKCTNMATEQLNSGKSVVIDNTNPSKTVRAQYIQFAKKNGIQCRCIYVDVPKEIAHHLNYVRQNMTKGQIRRIPDVGYNVFQKNFEPPSVAEGFSEIIKLNFSPDFENENHKKLFAQWTT